MAPQIKTIAHYNKVLTEYVLQRNPNVYFWSSWTQAFD